MRIIPMMRQRSAHGGTTSMVYTGSYKHDFAHDIRLSHSHPRSQTPSTCASIMGKPKYAMKYSAVCHSTMRDVNLVRSMFCQSKTVRFQRNKRNAFIQDVLTSQCFLSSQRRIRVSHPRQLNLRSFHLLNHNRPCKLSVSKCER
jgi:hypothetical protein